MNSANDMIERAREILGPSDGTDYTIRPTAHAEKYAEAAPALAEILRSSRVEAAAQEYERQDAIAIQAQKQFKRLSGRSNSAVLLTAIIGALVLVVYGFYGRNEIEGMRRYALIALGAAGGLAGALAAMWLYLIDKSRSLQKWMSRRADAETQRLAYFRAVTADSGSIRATSGVPLPLLQLEYFLRYQLEVQLTYYDRSSIRHESSAAKSLRIGSSAVLIGCIVTGISGLLSPLLAGVGVLGAALSSFASNREAMNQDRRNAERYERTRKTLQKLRGEIDGVRGACARGNSEPLQEFVTVVHDQLSLEHRQWLETEDSIGQALASLRKSLAKQEPES